jgi:hypothetical protein
MNQNFKKITVYPNFGGMIGIHILWQPPLLSVQVLPKKLKEEILVRYTNITKWINTHHQPSGGKSVNNHNRLRAVANHMMKEDNSHQWEHTIEYLDKMDSIRNTDWRTTFPELARHE